MWYNLVSHKNASTCLHLTFILHFSGGPITVVRFLRRCRFIVQQFRLISINIIDVDDVGE